MMESENVRIPKWFLQVLAALATAGLLGSFSWAIWVSVTLDRWTHVLENFPQRLERVEQTQLVHEQVQQVHTIEIRKLKKARVIKP